MNVVNDTMMVHGWCIVDEEAKSENVGTMIMVSTYSI